MVAVFLPLPIPCPVFVFADRSIEYSRHRDPERALSNPQSHPQFAADFQHPSKT